MNKELPPSMQPQKAVPVELQPNVRPTAPQSGSLLDQIKQGAALKRTQERQFAPKLAVERDQEERENLVRPAPKREKIRPIEEWE